MASNSPKSKASMPADSLMLTRKRFKEYSKQNNSDEPSETLTLSDLCLFFDWKHKLPHSPTLYKIANEIWLFLEPPSIEEYFVSFEHCKEYKVASQGTLPVLITSSPKGDILMMVEVSKKTDDMDFEDTLFLLILYPSYILDCIVQDSCIVKLRNGLHCTCWEIDNIERVTHLAMDRHSLIYFTDGEALYRISKTDGNIYSDHYETMFTPGADTTRITSLWRQNNDIYFSLHDWDSEINIDVWKLRPVRNRGISDNSIEPSSPASPTPSSGSDSELDSNEHCKKMKAFSLQYSERIWQLGSMRFDKKCLLSVGAAQMAEKPALLQIGFHAQIKVSELVPSKSVLWPRSASDEISHQIYLHKPSKSWFCVLPVSDTKAKDKLFWIQFKLNAKKKIIWQRLVPVPQDGHNTEWLYYDEVHDVLIGYKTQNTEEQSRYVLQYLPDLTKYLWIESQGKDAKDPKMQRHVTNPKTKSKKSKSKPQPKAKDATQAKTTSPKLKSKAKKVDTKPNIKPSVAWKKKEQIRKASRNKVRMMEPDLEAEEIVMD